MTVKIKVPETDFPYIENLSQMKSILEAKPELRLIDSGLGTLSVAYNISDRNTFKDPLACEARGITFDKETGNIIGRPLHKFFNLGEREDTLKNNVNFSDIFSIWDKIDGTMISLHRVNGNLAVKTKKSFLSNEAKRATQFLSKPENQNILKFCNELVDEFTPVFEFTDPENTIVISHKKMDVVLLHVRHIKTGSYIPYNDPDLTALVEKYNVKRLSPLNLKQTEKGTLDIDSVLEDLKVIEGIEGYIMQFNDGRMIKIKSDWYNAQHRAEAGLRERDVVKMFLDGTLDDVKGALKTDGYDITKLESIESNVLAELNKMETYITEKVELLKGLDMKSAALKINNEMPNNPLNGFVLISLRGKEPDLMTYFERNKLQDYSLAYLELPKLENEKEASVVRSRKMK
ncbi:RNA ligase [Shigella flexneri]